MVRIILTCLFFILALCCADDKCHEHELIQQLQQSLHKLEDEFKQYRAKSYAQIKSLEREVLRENRNSKSASQADNNIAFQAYMTVTAEYIPGQVIDFDEVQLNYGNAYDSSSAKFRCPVKGLYLFSTTGMSDTGDEFCLQIQVEGDAGSNKRNQTASFANNGHAHSQTTTAVVYCEEGDRVYVVNSWGQDAEVYATAWDDHQVTVYQTSFKGFLINLLA